MRLNSRGYTIYEGLLAIVILISLIVPVMLNLSIMLLNQENQQLAYEQKQLLIVNVIYYESNQIILNPEQVYLIDNQLCINWVSVDGKNKSACESIYL